MASNSPCLGRPRSDCAKDKCDWKQGTSPRRGYCIEKNIARKVKRERIGDALAQRDKEIKELVRENLDLKQNLDELYKINVGLLEDNTALERDITALQRGFEHTHDMLYNSVQHTLLRRDVPLATVRTARQSEETIKQYTARMVKTVQGDVEAATALIQRLVQPTHQIHHCVQMLCPLGDALRNDAERRRVTVELLSARNDLNEDSLLVVTQMLQDVCTDCTLSLATNDSDLHAAYTRLGLYKYYFQGTVSLDMSHLYDMPLAVRIEEALREQYAGDIILSPLNLSRLLDQAEDAAKAVCHVTVQARAFELIVQGSVIGSLSDNQLYLLWREISRYQLYQKESRERVIASCADLLLNELRVEEDVKLAVANQLHRALYSATTMRGSAMYATEFVARTCVLAAYCWNGALPDLDLDAEHNVSNPLPSFGLLSIPSAVPPMQRQHVYESTFHPIETWLERAAQSTQWSQHLLQILASNGRSTFCARQCALGQCVQR